MNGVNHGRVDIKVDHSYVFHKIMKLIKIVLIDLRSHTMRHCSDARSEWTTTVRDELDLVIVNQVQ